MEGHRKALIAGHILENRVVQGHCGHDNVPRSGPSNQSIREPASLFLSTPSGQSAPLASRGGNDSECPEITLDVCADSVMPVSSNDSARTLQERMMGKQLSSFGHAVIPNPPSQIPPVGVSPSVGKDRRKLVAAHAITEFKFVNSSVNDVNVVLRRFDDLAVDGLLHRSSFGRCIGMDGSKEFAVNLFDTLARRRNICSERINKAELLEFWDQICDNSFQTFIDMMDTDGDGRITIEELREIIALSSSANKLSKVTEKAEEYACLIMEELDSDNLGYIQPYMLKLLLEGSVSTSHMGTWGMSAPRASRSRDNHHETTEVADDSATMIARTSQHAIIQNVSSQVEQVWQEFRRLGTFSNHLGNSNSEHINRSKLGSKLGTDHALKALQSMSRTTRPVVEKLFNELSPNGLLHRSKFGLCIGVKEQACADNLFDALVRRCNIASDYINKAELLELWEQIFDQRFDSRLQIFTDMMENSPDGRLTEDEVKEIVILSSLGKELSGIRKNIVQEADGNEMPKNPEEYARVIMEELDPNNLGYVEMKMMQAQGQSLGIGTANNRDLGQMNRRLLQTVDIRWYQRAQYFLQDNWKGVRVMLLWLCICVGLFAWKFTQYRRRPVVFRAMGYCICVAKGGAETLKFNMALILLPVCRNTITWLRSRTNISNAVPLDDSIIFHKMIAVGIIIGSGLHVIPYVTCGFPRLLHLSDEDYKPMKIFFGEKRPANYRWFLIGTDGWTGMILLVLMAVTFTLATGWVRRSYRLPSLLRWLARYESFWYSHHLFVIVYALLIVHGNCLYLTRKWYNKTTWFYLSVPMFLYACERFTRALRSHMRPAKILKVTIFPGNVIRLQFAKPLGFKYKSGQYIYVNCAAVSPFQWHPFYVTSAPLDNHISIHIRTLGDWTAKLKTIFSQACRPPKEGQSGLLCAEYDGDGSLSNSNPRFPKVLIDGPYSAPAQDFEQYDIVLLIGLGIGVTPFISIMKDISNNSKHLEDIESGAVGRGATSSFRTRRAYIHWITREQGSLEWFNSVMEEVVETDKKGVIELHTYCTSVYAEGDARSALIATLNALSHAKDGVDVVSGSRVKTHFDRPNFRNVYRRIALNHRNQRVGVFYSGAPVLNRTLRELAKDFSRKTSTKFEFHSELY